MSAQTLPTAEHENLRRALRDGDLVVCLGPGVSAAAGVPTRATLVEAALAAVQRSSFPASPSKLAALAARLPHEPNYPRLLGELEQVLGRTRLEQVLSQDVLEDMDREPAPMLTALARLAPYLRLVVDTNLDRLALAAFEASGWSGHFALGRTSASRTRLVVKLCGDLHRPGAGWRLTEDDLARASKDATLQSFATALLRGRVILFLGFVADDPLLDWLIGLAPDDAPNEHDLPLHLALVPPSTNLAAERQRWAKRGVTLVALGDDASSHPAAVADLLDRFAVPLDARPEDKSTPPLDNPYPGLECFTEERASYFFGRDPDVDGAMTRLADDTEGRRWLAVEGPSGVGKSSFARAGLVPTLRRGKLVGAWTGKPWRVAVCRPGLRPFASVLAALHEAHGPESTLDASESLLALVRAHTASGHALALVIDQLEEALTFGDPIERDRLAEGLAELLREPSLPCLLVTTTRSDHVPDLARDMAALGSLLNTHALRHDLQPLPEKELHEAILRPARACAIELEPGLSQRILRDAQMLDERHSRAAIEPSGGLRRTSSQALPLVAHVLHELWTRRRGARITNDDYDALGGVERALTRSADSVLARLDEQERRAADNLLLHLVVPTRGRGLTFTRQTLRLADALTSAGGGELGRRVLAHLSAGTPAGTADSLAQLAVRLIATRGSHDDAQVDLIHEALLHAWQHLADLLRQRGIERIRTDDLEREAERWVRHNRSAGWLPAGARLAELLQAEPETEEGRAYRTALGFHAEGLTHAERRRARQRLAAFVGVVLVAVFLGGLSYVAITRGDALERETKNAENRLGQAVELARLLIWEVLPKLDDIPEARPVRKEILERLQEMLTKLGVTEKDRDARWEIMAAHVERGNEALHSDNLEKAREEYSAGLAIAEALAAADPTRAQAQRDLSVALGKLGDVEMRAGNLAAARSAFDRALKVDEALAVADPISAQAQRDLSFALGRLGDVEIQAGNLAAARSAFDRALKIREALAAADPTRAEAQRDLSVSLGNLGRVEMQAGNLAAARSAFDRSLKIDEALAAADPTSAEAQRDLSFSLDKLGDVEMQAGNLEAARSAFDRALKVREALAAADPTSAQAQRDLSASLDKLGDVEMQAGNLAAARSAFDRALKVHEELAAADPTSAQAQRDLSISLNWLGGVEMKAGNLAAARSAFDRSFKILEALAAVDPTSAQAQRDLSVALGKLGDVDMEAGNLADARSAFDRSLKVAEALAADPTSAHAQRDLSVSLNDLGNAEMRVGNLAAARSAFDRALKVREALAAADPTSAQARRDLSVALGKLGDVEMQAGNLAAARSAFDRSLKVREALVEADPTSARTQRDLSVSLNNLGDLEMQAGNLAAARSAFDRSLKVAEALAAADPTSAEAQRDRFISLDRLGGVEMQAGNLAAARSAYDSSLKVAEALATADPTSAEAQRDLSLSLDRLGDVETQAGNLAAARSAFDRSLKVAEALAAVDATSARAQRDLSISLGRLGDVEMEMGNLAAARSAFDRSLKILTVLAAADPTSAQAKRDLFVSLGKLGGVELEAGNLAAARSAYDRSLKVAEALAAADPASALAQRDLSVSLERLGDVEMKAGNLAAARSAFDRSLKILEALAEANPTSGEASFDVVLSHIRLVMQAARAGDLAERNRELRIAKIILDAMEAKGQLAGFHQREQVRDLVNSMLAELSAP